MKTVSNSLLRLHLLIGLLISFNSYADSYWGVTGGYGKFGSISIEGSKVFENSTPESKLFVGGGMTLTNNGGEKWEKDSNYAWDNESEFYAIIGNTLTLRNVPTKDSATTSDFFIATTVGFSLREVTFIQTHCYVWTSAESCGLVGKRSKDAEYFFNWSVQLRRVSPKGYIVGIGYHNRRGILLHFGIPFLNGDE